MLEAQFDTVRRRFGEPTVIGSNGHLERLQVELAGYFAGSVRAFRVPLVYPGTPFQLRVWEMLLSVPYGETRSYQDLASAVGDPAAVRAVGRANGMNRIAILIPCHPIVNKSGDLGGYGGRLRRNICQLGTGSGDSSGLDQSLRLIGAASSAFPGLSLLRRLRQRGLNRGQRATFSTGHTS